MSEVTFTVVVPAHNAASTVESAIRSVLVQSRQDFEIVVVDDGSTDDTASRVARLAGDRRIRLVRRSCGGPAAARNTGIRAGRGRLVSMLDADDLWLPSYLDEMAEAMDADPEAGLAYTDAWVLDDATGRIRRTTAMSGQRPPPTPPEDARDLLLMLAERNFIYTSATVRRAVLDEVGGYDERLWHGEDYELWLRIAARGHRAVRANGILAIHRDREGSLTGRAEIALARAIDLYGTIAREYDDEQVRRLAEAQRRALTKHLKRLTNPTQAQRLERATRRLYSAWSQRSAWLDEPPEELARALARVLG